MHAVNLAQGCSPATGGCSVVAVQGPEILERARDYSEEVESEQHPDNDHPAQSCCIDPVRSPAAVAEEIIGSGEESHGRR